ncbi:hypothetical protein J437_LFUL011982 [Ladona fulva]|uniref:Uncharacterized protein n=1 Tax=Ladona fulva TaxID=123851 RepID=A0A8K0P9Z9_LADFU|nr:hypothetical protein J437_LFUL011982 [Ladona fulva]
MLSVERPAAEGLIENCPRVSLASHDFVVSIVSSSYVINGLKCDIWSDQTGYSEDSDYTSDLNYPIGQNANSSASQFRSAAHQICTPQRSLETSRENSYERDDGGGRVPHGPGPGGGDFESANTESEPLYYNSRPKDYKEYR